MIPEFFDGARFQRVRPVAGEQAVEQHAQRVDIAGRGDLLAMQLLRAGILRRHRLHGGEGRRGVGDGGLQGVGVEQFGDAEIQQLDGAFLGHQDVLRLEVAMDHQVLMRVVDGGADGEEEIQPFADGEPVGIAVLIDRGSGDEVHHEIGPPVRGGAAIQEFGDIGVIEVRQDLAFGIEAFERVVAEDAAADDLDGDHFAVQVVDAHGLVDRAHAAFGDELHDAVGAQAGADRRGCPAAGGVSLGAAARELR